MVKIPIEINFTDSEGNDIAKELGLTGLTFEEAFKKIVRESRKVAEKLRRKFGDDKVWMPEKEAYLNRKEELWLRLGDYFAKFIKNG